MHTIAMQYNNFANVVYSMKQITLLHQSHQVGEKPTSTFFPRIIREFEDYDEPMMYGEKN